MKRNMRKSMGSLLLATALLAGCGQTAATESTASAAQSTAETTAAEPTETTAAEAVTNLPQIDSSAWNYNEEADVYWQVGLATCETPADESYETMGIFVPGAYFTATANGDGTYTCTVNESGAVGGYTAATAPMVMPIETPGYAAMAAPTGYSSSVEAYTSAGFIYLYAGARGRDAGAPAGVTDFKAAIRYTRYNAELLPGDTDAIFTFGMSGGGAQSALLGATGDSDLYEPYLQQIGAVSGVSDAVAGAMCWCPITNLDTANEAYEWNLGATRTGLSDFEQQLSDEMAAAFADYINSAGLQDADGNILTLTESDEGIYQSGSYYDYIQEVIETSLNDFLAVTEFPYTPSAGNAGISAGDRGQGGGMGAMGGGQRGDFDFESLTEEEKAAIAERFGGGEGGMPEGEQGELPEGGQGGMPTGDAALTPQDEQAAQYAADGVTRTETAAAETEATTYETAEDYIASLNAAGAWVLYDSATNTATITSVADFVSHCKTANKGLGAFDQLDASQGENTLFGYGEGGAHFDATMAALLEGSEYADAYAEDLAKTDSVGNTVDTRLAMYTPLYYLLQSYEGYGTSTVASYWRIRTGINQADTALSTEVNLALALEQYPDTDVDFATIWGCGHTQAELTGDSESNFIEWVNECMQA